VPATVPLEPENFKVGITSTGTRDEAWFYQVSAAIDSYSPVFIAACLRLVDQPHDRDEVIDALVPEIRSITRVLKRIYERCEPEIFYHRVRPFLKAWGKGSKEFPLGLRYETGANGTGPRCFFVGGSASQDSLIQLIDIIAGIRHGTGYLKEMRAYMPRGHREFLEWAESAMESNVCGPESDSELKLRDAISSFRLVHMSVVRDYIVKPGGAHSVGTGGTDPVPFLRKIIEETKGEGCE
jgi:indoleamine 2,3-dioxygenase